MPEPVFNDAGAARTMLTFLPGGSSTARRCFRRTLRVLNGVEQNQERQGRRRVAVEVR